MQTLDFECIDSDFPLFDVVISMPLGASVETIQKLAATEAGLPPERVERLIAVLRTTPNAKVGSGLLLERAEEEKARFMKAGLHVELRPTMPMDLAETKDTSFEALIGPQMRAEREKTEPVSKGGFLSSGTGLLVGTTVVIAIGLLYMAIKGTSVSGISLPWNDKQTQRSGSGTPPSQQMSAGAAAGATATAAQAGADLSGDVDADDRLIQAARASSFTVAAQSSPADGIAKPAKQLLKAEFAILLAEIGQGGRAREVLKAMAASIDPTADVQGASALQAAQIKVQAWAVQRMDAGQALPAVQDLKAETQAVANAQERTQLQIQTAVILSRNTRLPADETRAFLSMATESSKGFTGRQADALAGDLAVSTAQVLLNETIARARAGTWTRAKASATQIEELVKQGPDAWAQTRLSAIDYAAQLQTGQTDKAAKSLDAALALAMKNTNPAERARWLRSIAQLSDAVTQDQFEATTNALQIQLNANSGLEKARGLTELSLLYTSAGLPGKAGQLRSLAQATAGLSTADLAGINTDLSVRGDMAMAKTLHGMGRYAEAEAALQRVTGSLF